MKKSNESKNSSIISNKPKKILDLSEFIPKKKMLLKPINKNFFDPNELHSILKDSSVLKLLQTGSHKKNFMILNSVIRQQKTKSPQKNNEPYKKSRNFSEPNLNNDFTKLDEEKNSVNNFGKEKSSLGI